MCVWRVWDVCVCDVCVERVRCVCVRCVCGTCAMCVVCVVCVCVVCAVCVTLISFTICFFSNSKIRRDRFRGSSSFTWTWWATISTSYHFLGSITVLRNCWLSKRLRATTGLETLLSGFPLLKKTWAMNFFSWHHHHNAPNFWTSRNTRFRPYTRFRNGWITTCLYTLFKNVWFILWKRVYRQRVNWVCMNSENGCRRKRVYTKTCVFNNGWTRNRVFQIETVCFEKSSIYKNMCFSKRGVWP